MSAQGTYPIGSRTLSASDTVTGVVTGATADVPLSMLANFASLNSSFAYAVEKQTASIGQTVFTLGSPYSNGVAGALAVYADGLRMVKDVDYTETNSTTVTFTSAVTYDYEVVFVIGGEVGIPPVSIVSVTLTSGTHAPGTLDTYTITFSDASTTNFQVYNGADYPVDGSGAFSTLSASGAVSGAGFLALFASPPPIGSVAAGSGAFTTLSASGAVSGAGFSNYFASPPALGSTAPAAGTFTTVTSTGNAALGDAEATDTHAIKGATTLLANSASAALTVTQTGAGNAFVVEDSASTDSTPFVIDANGKVAIGTTTAVENLNILSNTRNFVELTRASSNTGQSVLSFRKARGDLTTPTVVSSGDASGSLNAYGYDGSAYVQLGAIDFSVDGTPGTNDMPGRLVFSTTADGASTPTERMRIGSAGSVGIGATSASISLRVAKSVTGGTIAYGVVANGQVQTDVTVGSYGFASLPSFANYAAAQHKHFDAAQGTISGTLTDQKGFSADSNLTGATNNYGFYGNIAAAANRYNFYAAGTADNYFAGNVGVGRTPSVQVKTDIGGTYPTSGAESYGLYVRGTGPAATTGNLYGIVSQQNTEDAAFTVTNIRQFTAFQGTITGGSRLAPVSQFGFFADSSLVGATNNYSFYGNIAAGANRYNFYAAGTAANYFAGDIQLGKTVTAGGTTGAQTINKTVGTVNFAAAATSLVVTNSLVTTSSIITATVGTNDSTMKSVAVVAAAGSFTLHANAAATAETRVNFHVFN